LAGCEQIRGINLVSRNAPVFPVAGEQRRPGASRYVGLLASTGCGTAKVRWWV
jgi:hypothetical protein